MMGGGDSLSNFGVDPLLQHDNLDLHNMNYAMNVNPGFHSQSRFFVPNHDLDDGIQPEVTIPPPLVTDDSTTTSTHSHQPPLPSAHSQMTQLSDVTPMPQLQTQFKFPSMDSAAAALPENAHRHQNSPGPHLHCL